MVKVMKVAVWKVGERYVEDAKEATRLVRVEVIRELMAEDNPSAYEDEADYISYHWDTIDQRTRAAMAGT